MPEEKDQNGKAAAADHDQVPGLVSNGGGPSKAAGEAGVRGRRAEKVWGEYAYMKITLSLCMLNLNF